MNMNLVSVLRHFHVSDQSIWPALYNATLTAAGYEYPLDRLCQIEDDIQVMQVHVGSCLNDLHQPVTPPCLEELLELITQNTNDVQWMFKGSVIREDTSLKIHYRTGGS